MMRNSFRLSAILLTCCAGSLLSAAELTGANAEVVVAPDAPPATRFAAAESRRPPRAATQSSSAQTRGAARPVSVPRHFPATPTA